VPSQPAGSPASLSELLPEEAIRLSVEAADWRAAIRASNEALVAAGITEPAYGDEMVAMVEEHGPYIVIAPGIALAHARPSPAVRRAGLSLVTLEQPVAFGHEANDPVRLVVGLAAPEQRAHVDALATLAALLADEASREALLASRDAAEVRAIVRHHEEGAAGRARDGVDRGEP
jgi:PTS system ascorbate-specific IIA component